MGLFENKTYVNGKEILRLIYLNYLKPNIEPLANAYLPWAVSFYWVLKAILIIWNIINFN